MREDCLSSRKLFRSESLEETIEQCSKIFWPHQMSILRQDTHVSTVVDGIIHNELSLIYIKHGADVVIDAGENHDYYLIQYNLSGNGRCKCGTQITETAPGTATILSPNLHSLMQYDEQTSQLVLRLKRNTVEAYLEELMLCPLDKPLVFDLKMQQGSRATQTWGNALHYIITQYDMYSDDSYPDWDGAFANMTIDLILRLQPHSYSGKLNGNEKVCHPTYVRRAQEYIHANCEETISMTQLSVETGVTSRTLQYGFNKFLGRTPMDYVRSIKLQKIHEELLSVDADIRVSEILTKYDVYNFGRFATRYKNRYGCLPSETLKRRYSPPHKD